MDKPITDYEAFFLEVKQAVMEVGQLRDQEEKLNLKESQLERAIELEKKSVEDKIAQTTKKRADELDKSYDVEISKCQDRLKKSRTKREKARNQGKKERIEEETTPLRRQNREAEVRMETLYQKEGVPRICATGWFFSLYMPRRLSEFARLLLAVLICFLALPCAIYYLLPRRELPLLVVVYFIIVIVFGGLYILIANKTKVPHQAELKQGRQIRDEILANKKKIKALANTIRKDKNDVYYDLQKYDDEIAQIEQELNEISNKKKEALNTFDTVTRTILADEITSSSKGRIDKLTDDLTKVTEEAARLASVIKEKNLYITDHYEVYLGRDFLTLPRLEALEKLIKDGTAQNLTEAVAAYKKTR